MDRLRAATARIKRIWEGGAAAVGVPMSALDNFLKYVSTSPDSECWIWTGATYSDGTGDFTWQTGNAPKNARTHRLMYQLLNKRKVHPSIPIAHTCEENLCLNPEHLEERPRGGRGSRGGPGSYKRTSN